MRSSSPRPISVIAPSSSAGHVRPHFNTFCMKILWVKTDFLHPTDRGGQIRTLETLRRLHPHHEVHYLAYHNPTQPEGLARASEYCSFA